MPGADQLERDDARRAAQERVRDRLAVLLAVNSGATDAIGFLALGGAFASVMTGNMVITGVGAATGDGSLIVLAVSAIVSFVVGCAVGARLAGLPQSGDPVWPAAVTRALAVQTALTVVLSIAWWVTGPERGETVRLILLGGHAVALGLQSSTVQRFGAGGLSTTYLTGTLTGLVVRLATGGGVRSVGRNAALLLGLIGGAALGAVLTAKAWALAPLTQLVPLVLVLALGMVLTTSSKRLERITRQADH